MLSGSLVAPALERELSMRSDCRTGHADPRLRPVASPSPRPSLLASERSRQLNLQRSTVSSRSGLHADGLRHAAEEPTLALARLPSNRSSRTALSAARHRPSQEQRHSSLSLHRFSVAGTSRHGKVTGSTPFADRRDSICRSSGRGDQWALESSSGSSRRRSVSRELSLGQSSRLHGRATTPRHVGADVDSSSSVPPRERLDSGLSVSMASLHGRGACRTRRGYAGTLFLEQHGGDHSKPHQTKQHSFHGALPAPISSKREDSTFTREATRQRRRFQRGHVPQHVQR